MLRIRTIIISAPDELRDELIALKAKKAAERCATMRPRAGHDALSTTKRALRSVGRRFRALDAAAKPPAWPATTPNGYATKLHSPRCPAPAPSRHF